MAGQETPASHRGKPASHRKALSHREERPSLSDRFKRLSDRTPLRTKLITAVLALVIMALAAISVTSVVVLRGYLYTQHDGPLRKRAGQLQAMLDRASDRGEPAPALNDVLDCILAPIYLRAIFGAGKPREEHLALFVDRALAGA